MGEPSVNVGVVDIGTNSMRLLITSTEEELGRWVEVTGLGRGVDETGVLSPESISATRQALARFGELMDSHDVEQRKAIATSASRDAMNREEFFDAATQDLGVRPTMITGVEEARYAFDGATRGMGDSSGVVVSDIGGGSTEFVTSDASVSIDIGSVRLTDRILTDRPAPGSQVEAAALHVGELFSDIGLSGAEAGIGIAGTWTSLAAVAQGLPRYDRISVHDYRLDYEFLDRLVTRLGAMTVEETASIPSLDPKRAPVILSGAVIAREVLRHLAMDSIKISEQDTLDGVADELLSLP